ncbi:DNA mismatch repair endonuclease MutH [Legionella worsleiensis]|uniref:DNA mismatch repair protein MutH n=1 Tax=Legionella worsleiensis TaxID=45076 RepID=A0A0W1A692_9GAMM|nr:DNA mismatch repair endonuclease MutH [Legionella worsleiensis]KTD76887.1 DNA mismatch repair protein [Legionella worsleiensis]STY33443.1 DNA mismatch repair protein MutH [Legionella worsleiensis]
MPIYTPKINPPTTECELLARSNAIQGLSFVQLSMALKLSIPANPVHRKGWVGMALELALGTDANNKAEPDFQQLGIELKTLPIARSGRPAESTFVTSIPLLTVHHQKWKSSQCYAKLKRVLWLPVEGDKNIPFEHRRIGKGFLWSPNDDEERILSADWNYLTAQISTGNLEQINATVGTYLQIRPKAATGKCLCFSYDADGNKVKTLPRGFYLRTVFTNQILVNYG